MEWLEARRQAFPDAWRTILEREVGFYSQFDAQARARFEDQLKIFILTKEFASTDGFVIDDHVKVVVAATACRLTVNLPGEHFGRLRFITVRPKSFHNDRSRVVGTAHRNKVVLSWDALQHGLRDPNDGDNVGYHEFAHVLDAADGSTDGMPMFCDPTLYGRWTEVMGEALQFVRDAKREGRASLLGDYAARNEAELFAVATEIFFERPRAMRSRHPRLYELLAEYFQQTPHTSSKEPPESTHDSAAPPSAAAPTPATTLVPIVTEDPVPAEVLRRAESRAIDFMASGPASTDPARTEAQRARLLHVKDPDGWQAQDFVLLVGGASIALGLVLFIVPQSDEARPWGSELWSRLQAAGEFGKAGPILLGVGLVALLVGAMMKRDE